MLYLFVAYAVVCFCYATYLVMENYKDGDRVSVTVVAILVTTLIAPITYSRRRANRKRLEAYRKLELETKAFQARASAKEQERNDRTVMNFPVGQRVIVKSNEDTDPFFVGTVISHEPITQARTMMPIVKRDSDGKELLCLGKMHYYSPGKEAALKKLTPREQWNVMAEFAAKD